MLLQRLKRALAAGCGALAALSLFAIMLLTFFDVSGRKLLDRSLPGSFELTELLMVAVIFAALPLVSLRGEHVVFDSLDERLGARLLRVQQVVIDLLCAAALGALAWLMWVKAGQMLAYGDTTAQLGIAQGPFVYAMSVLLGLTALIHLLLVLEPVAHHHPGVAEPAAR